MTDHTPTTERIRAGFEATRMISEPPDGFDLWLADHNRKIAAEALREAAETFARTIGEPAHPGRSVVCLDMDAGLVTDVQTWLRDRADRIEQGGEL